MGLIHIFVGVFIIQSISGCSKNFEGLEWTQIGDFESKTSKQYFICRGFDKESNCVGTFVTESKDICYAICNEKSKELKDFEILQCAESGIWAPVFDQYIPYNSFDLGKSREKPIYACRGFEGETIGVVTRVTCTDQERCEEKLVCKIVVMDKLSFHKTKQLDKFTIFTTTNTLIKTDIDKDSDNILIQDPYQHKILTFNLKAKHEVTLSFKNSFGTSLFEILIGGLENSIIAIRKGKSYSMYSNTSQALNVLRESEFLGFWVYWGKSTLEFGKADKYLKPQSKEDNSIISLRDAFVYGITKYLLASESDAEWHIFK